MRPHFTWRLRSRTLELGPRTLLMGVLNVTPDSFSDGGRFFEPRAAIEHGLALLDEGADILDIGGESTRPGTWVVPDESSGKPIVTEDEELRRVMPVVANDSAQHVQAVSRRLLGNLDMISSSAGGLRPIIAVGLSTGVPHMNPEPAQFFALFRRSGKTGWRRGRLPSPLAPRTVAEDRRMWWRWQLSCW